ncbi:MAG: hypothetical protein DME93_08165 [Verrucomicrobia bacterium]|nr:MAG: hypothetical protein DME93_08165 [Verrucomicrobiota bacterium]
MTNDETMTKSECRKKQRRGFSHLNIRISFDIRHPSFAAYKPYKMQAPDLCLRGFVIFSAPSTRQFVMSSEVETSLISNSFQHRLRDSSLCSE